MVSAYRCSLTGIGRVNISICIEVERVGYSADIGATQIPEKIAGVRRGKEGRYANILKRGIGEGRYVNLLKER